MEGIGGTKVKEKENMDEGGRLRGPKRAKNERDMEEIDMASMWHRCGIDAD